MNKQYISNASITENAKGYYNVKKLSDREAIEILENGSPSELYGEAVRMAVQALKERSGRIY